MSNYDLSKVSSDASNPQQTLSPYIGYGSGQILRINNIELKFSVNTGSPKAILHMETKPITTEGFKPLDNFKGRVGKVACGIYMKDDKSKRDFLQKMKIVAAALSLEDEINDVKGETFEEVVSKIESVICGKNNYARYTVFAEEYPKPNKVGITLLLPRFGFVESLDTDPTTLVQFDKTNNFHYKKLPIEQHNSSGVTNSELDSQLPF